MPSIGLVFVHDLKTFHHFKSVTAFDIALEPDPAQIELLTKKKGYVAEITRARLTGDERSLCRARSCEAARPSATMKSSPYIQGFKSHPVLFHHRKGNGWQNDDHQHPDEPESGSWLGVLRIRPIKSQRKKAVPCMETWTRNIDHPWAAFLLMKCTL